MTQDAAGVFREDKDLAGLVAASLASLETSGPIIGADAKKPAVDAGRRSINLDDKWARVEMARLCAAAVYADWTSTQDFVKAIGASFWKMLCLLATRQALLDCLEVKRLLVLQRSRSVSQSRKQYQLANTKRKSMIHEIDDFEAIQDLRKNDSKELSEGSSDEECAYHHTSSKMVRPAAGIQRTWSRWKPFGQCLAACHRQGAPRAPLQPLPRKRATSSCACEPGSSLPPR